MADYSVCGRVFRAVFRCLQRPGYEGSQLGILEITAMDKQLEGSSRMTESPPFPINVEALVEQNRDQFETAVREALFEYFEDGGQFADHVTFVVVATDLERTGSSKLSVHLLDYPGNVVSPFDD
jgi:hypothetical protein